MRRMFVLCELLQVCFVMHILKLSRNSARKMLLYDHSFYANKMQDRCRLTIFFFGKKAENCYGQHHQRHVTQPLIFFLKC